MDPSTDQYGHLLEKDDVVDYSLSTESCENEDSGRYSPVQFSLELLHNQGSDASVFSDFSNVSVCDLFFII